MRISKWQKLITEVAISKGFTWDLRKCTRCGRNDLDTMLLRLHSEVTEAGEEARDNKHEEIAYELADLFIRLANTSEVMGIDLEEYVRKKMEKNIKRPVLHGRKNK